MDLSTLRAKLAARIKHREGARKAAKHERELIEIVSKRLGERKTDFRHDKGAIAYLRELIKKVAIQTPPQVMFDSVDVSQIPSDAKAVAGYVGGRWPTFGTLVARFPKAKRLSIAIAASEDAECLDCEPGDATVAQVAAWVKRQKARGVKRPVVYASASTMPEVLKVLAANGIARSSVRLWSAHYSGAKHICAPHICGFPEVDGTQWTDTSHGRNLDESYLSKGFFS